MAIDKRSCVVCGAEFYGSKNAKFCSSKCKQKDYYERSKNKKQLSSSESDNDSSRDNAADRGGEE